MKITVEIEYPSDLPSALEVRNAFLEAAEKEVERMEQSAQDQIDEAEEALTQAQDQLDRAKRVAARVAFGESPQPKKRSTWLPQDWRCPHCKEQHAVVNDYGLITCRNGHQTH